MNKNIALTLVKTVIVIIALQFPVVRAIVIGLMVGKFLCYLTAQLKKSVAKAFA